MHDVNPELERRTEKRTEQDFNHLVAFTMTSMDMSLDEIIARNKQERRGFRKGFGSRSGRYGGRAFKSYVDFDAPLPIRGPKIGGAGNPNKTVRINISNLAPSVVSSDLEELFANYRIEAATVNYNESGISVGTGDIYLRKSDAENVISDFKGVALDGQVMRMVLVDASDSLGTRIRVTPRSGGMQRSFRSGSMDFPFINPFVGFLIITIGLQSFPSNQELQTILIT
uniref:RRM domain-containing protein n=1 Tax=Angiostrongylus cantonensis TaxID=6313 RepID=A0A0K0CXX7_ANGCA